MDSFTETWSLVCDYCKNKITKVAFQTWISRIEPKEIDFDIIGGGCLLLRFRPESGCARYGIYFEEYSYV